MRTGQCAGMAFATRPGDKVDLPESQDCENALVVSTNDAFSPEGQLHTPTTWGRYRGQWLCGKWGWWVCGVQRLQYVPAAFMKQQ